MNPIFKEVEPRTYKASKGNVTVTIQNFYDGANEETCWEAIARHPRKFPHGKALKGKDGSNIFESYDIAEKVTLRYLKTNPEIWQ